TRSFHLTSRSATLTGQVLMWYPNSFPEVSVMKSVMLTALAAAVLVIGLGAAKDDEGAVKELRQAVRALNDAFAKSQPEAIKRLTTEEHVAITPYYGGLQTLAEQLKNLGDLKVPDYATGEVKVTLLTKDAALVTYPMSQKGTYKGKPVDSKN